jgi:hypothetical protein
VIETSCLQPVWIALKAFSRAAFPAMIFPNRAIKPGQTM